MVIRQIRVIGRVQGVGFRDALRAEAVRLGVAGWVRNRADGSVEALLQGSHDSVKRLMDWTRRGPPMARVDRLEDIPVASAPQAQTRDFHILPGA
jgi:acylphosphatase